MSTRAHRLSTLAVFALLGLSVVTSGVALLGGPEVVGDATSLVLGAGFVALALADRRRPDGGRLSNVRVLLGCGVVLVAVGLLQVAT